MSDIIRDKKALDRLIAQSISKPFGKLLDEAPIAPPAPPAPAPQQAAPSTPQPPPGDGVNQVSVSKVATGAPGESDTSGSDLQKGQITIEMVVEKLNSIRSGRSFKDENILGQMQTYFNDLNDNEKLALYAFLKGIAQIVTGEIMAQQSTTPQSLEKEMKQQGDGETKSGMKDIRHIKPNIISKSTPKATPPSKENTSAPLSSPIVPKQR